MTADVERHGEGARHIEQPVGQPVGNLTEQEIVSRQFAGRALAVGADQSRLKYLGGWSIERCLGHDGSDYGVARPPWQTGKRRLHEDRACSMLANAGHVAQRMTDGTAIEVTARDTAAESPRRTRFPGAVGLWRRVIDTVLPPRCLDCGIVVEGEVALCADCWPRYTFLSSPSCACCGFPFEFDPGPADPLCGACMARQPSYRRARAVLAYDEAVRPLILDFKHGDRTGVAPVLGRWLARAAAEMISEADCVVPVPLHRRRLFERRYNQSALLAAAIGRLSGLPVHTNLLVRRRATRSQGHLSPSARRRNVKGAFAPGPGGRPAVAGRRILLVDDVYTTGATVEECARVLLRNGAAHVDVVTLARVVRARKAVV